MISLFCEGFREIKKLAKNLQLLGDVSVMTIQFLSVAYAENMFLMCDMSR